MRVIRTSGQDAVPMQQMQGQSMQPMPTMPELGYEQREFYRGAYVGMKMQVQMQQQQQSTHALDSAGSSTLHQIPEEHHERTGGQTGHALQNRPTRAFGGYNDDDYIDEYRPSRTSSELEHAHDNDNDSEDIGACMAVE